MRREHLPRSVHYPGDRAEQYRSAAAPLGPVLDQVDPRDDVDDRVAVDRENSRITGQQQSIRLVELNADVELRQRPGHDIADADAAGIGVVMKQPGQRNLLHAADRMAVAQDRQLRDAAGLQADGRLPRRLCRARW